MIYLKKFSLGDKMFNQEIFNQYLSSYKKNFSINNLQEPFNEWEVVKCFQDNWDINSENFSETFSRAFRKLSSTRKFIYQFASVMIRRFATQEPELTRKIFRNLYDENIDICTRFEKFKLATENLFEKYRQGNERSSNQTENSISAYLFLRYPNKYYIYKYTMYRKAADILQSTYEFNVGDYKNNVKNFYDFGDEICEALSKDVEMLEILRKNLNDNCYSDDNLKILTTNFIFNVGRIR